MSDDSKLRLKVIGDGCRGVLDDLQNVVDKYESLGTQSKRTWDRLKWGQENVADLRSRLTAQTVMLSAFISASQAIVEKRLNKFLREFQDGKREGSVVTAQTVESMLCINEEDEQAWRLIRKELEDIGITAAAFEANKGFILDWFRTAITEGAFEELAAADSQPRAIMLGTQMQSVQSQISQKAIFPASVSPGTESGPSGIKQTGLPIVPDSVTTGQARTRHVPRIVAWIMQYDRKLIIATCHNDPTAVHRLLQKGASGAAKDDYEMTALHYGAILGHGRVIRQLIERGTPVDIVDWHGHTALHLAAACGYKEVAQLLLDYGAYVDAVDKAGRTALHLIPAWADMKDIRLAEHRAGWGDANIPQHQVAISTCEEVAQVLVNHGANINAADQRGRTALHVAAIYGHKAVVQLLLDRGANINVVCRDRRTALHWAAVDGHQEVVKILVNHGANIHAADREGMTALHMAATFGHKAVVQLLLDSGVNIDVVCGWNRSTALHLAVGYRRQEVVQLLLNRGVNIDVACGWTRSTALHLAVDNGHQELVRLLLEHGADANARDRYGHTAMYLAETEGYTSICKELSEYASQGGYRPMD